MEEKINKLKFSDLLIVGKVAKSDIKVQNLKQISNGNKIVIPTIQRGPSWDEKLLSPFLENLLEMFVEREGSLGMGHFYKCKTGKNVDAYDSQQRMLTIIILLCIIRNFAEELKKKDIQNEIEKFLFVYEKEFVFFYAGSDCTVLNDILSKISKGQKIEEDKKDYEYVSRLKKTHKEIECWFKSCLNSKNAFKTIYEFSKFLIHDITFCVHYHKTEKSASKAFVNSNRFALRLDDLKLWRGRLLNNVSFAQQKEFSKRFGKILDKLKDEGFFTGSKKTIVAEIFIKDCCGMHFGVSSDTDGVTKLIFEKCKSEKYAFEILERFEEYVSTAISIRNEIRDGSNYSLLKIILNSNKKVFGWFKALIANEIFSDEKIKKQRRALLDRAISYPAIMYANLANINTSFINNSFCDYIKKNPKTSVRDNETFFKILADKTNQTKNKSTNFVLNSSDTEKNKNIVIETLKNRLSDLSSADDSQRKTMQSILFFIESGFCSLFYNEDINAHFAALNSNIHKEQDENTITQEHILDDHLSEEFKKDKLDFRNRLGNKSILTRSENVLAEDFNYSQKREKVYKKSRFILNKIHNSSDFLPGKNTKNQKLLSDLKCPPFGNVKKMNEELCNRREEFLKSSFINFWLPLAGEENNTKTHTPKKWNARYSNESEIKKQNVRIKKTS